MKKTTLAVKMNAAHLDAALDEALDESFPASDPVAVSFPRAAARPGKTRTDSTEKNREIELKLQIDAIDVNLLSRHPLLKKYAAGKPHREHLTSTYFDTPDLALARRHAALRVRRSGAGWVQTFKCGGASHALLHSRHEWETAVPGPALDIKLLRKAIEPTVQWRTLLRKLPLQQIFVTDFSRTLWNLHLPEGNQVELVLDRGAITRDAQTEVICEIELELKTGNAGALFDCAQQLLASIPLRIDNLSKAERGYALCMPERQPSAVHADTDTLSLHKRMSVESGFSDIIANCLGQIQGNQTALSQADDPEALHQMRVGLRRLRSALDLFRQTATLPSTMREQLDWLASILAPARDWEVLCNATLSAIVAAAPANPDLSLLQTIAGEIAHDMRAQARTAVQSARFTGLMLSFSAWLESAAWRNALPQTEAGRSTASLPRFADKCLKRGHRRMHRRSKNLHSADPLACHKLRIAAKGARYAAEFFQSLYPAKAAHAYIDALAALQDELGRRNDAAVAAKLLQSLAEMRPELHAGIDVARDNLRSIASGKKGRLRRLWQRFASLKAPNRK